MRLSGHVQRNDRVALREIARQVAKQINRAFGAELENDEDASTEDDPSQVTEAPSHLPTLISSLPTLGRPTIIVIDAFDLFAEHGRQALLYCLLDTAQSCRAGTSNRGLAVVGVTTRVDTLNMLEKRVKSRFSGRMLRTATPHSWEILARSALMAPIPTTSVEWTDLWALAVKRFLADRTVREALSETFGLVRDARLLARVLVSAQCLTLHFISIVYADNPDHCTLAPQAMAGGFYPAESHRVAARPASFWLSGL